METVRCHLLGRFHNLILLPLQDARALREHIECMLSLDDYDKCCLVEDIRWETCGSAIAPFLRYFEETEIAGQQLLEGIRADLEEIQADTHDTHALIKDEIKPGVDLEKAKTHFSKAQDGSLKVEGEIKKLFETGGKGRVSEYRDELDRAGNLLEAEIGSKRLPQPATDYLRYSHRRAGRLLSAVATAKYQGYDNLELNEHDPLAGPIDTEEHSEEILREEAAREELLAKYLN